ncbi:MAG TPA: FIST N-terminal domain-containing protein [Gemmatimonadaceae bacterium]|jgi:hypothetical protein|nr:FIST N-terminal domain-containing protein [Gemmatimonadaceae bacterium]
MKLEQYQWTPARGWDRPPERSSLGASAQLALLFGRASLVESSRCAPLVHRTFPKAQLVGCSTGGEILGEQVGDDTLALTLVSFEHSRVETSRVTIGEDGSFAAGHEVVRRLDPRGLRHVFVLSEGLQVDSSAMVRGIDQALPPGVSVSGGFAADANRFEVSHVWSSGVPERDTVVAIGFYGERLRIGVSVTGGWGPFGPDRLITKSRGRVLYEFDGRPALALYKKYLGEHSIGLPATGLSFPLELRTGDAGDGRVLRSLLAVDEDAQSISFAGDVPEGATARFMVGHIEDLIDGSAEAATRSLAGFADVAPELSLIVSCNARRTVLKQRVDEEIEAVRSALGASTTLAGFYSYGEIAPPHVGVGTELHNETMTITNLAEV